MLPFWFGTIAGLAPWISIAVSIIGSATVPGSVYGIVIAQFVLFFSFGLNQWLQYRGVGRWGDYAYGKKAYLVLSLSAKSILAWQIFAGSSRTDLPCSSAGSVRDVRNMRMTPSTVTRIAHDGYPRACAQLPLSHPHLDLLRGSLSAGLMRHAVPGFGVRPCRRVDVAEGCGQRRQRCGGSSPSVRLGPDEKVQEAMSTWHGLRRNARLVRRSLA